MTELPTTFGKYFLTDKLATGGMAEIFLAKLIGPGGFEKAMVIKQIHPALSSQRAFVDLFVAEAKTLVSLTQGNIVPVYELGVVDDTYFIAMEYIDGPTLWQLTEAVFARGDAIVPAIAAHVVAEIAKGLDYAHRKGAGVIHRDLSPRNVMLTRDGEVKLVDFGIAVALGDPGDAGGDGLPTGSFPYMSPEQAAGAALSGQTDLFSLGVLAWEMLAGRRLFARDEPRAILDAVTSAPIVPPSSVRPGVPPRLEVIVMRALARDRAARWATAAELSAACQRFLADETELTGARDLAALIARVCPPVLGLAAAGQDAPATHHDDHEPAPEGDVGPSTMVVPRAEARGKRKPTVREATFATHVELERVMGPVTPAMARSGSATGSGSEPGTETGEYMAPTGIYTAPPKSMLQPIVRTAPEPPIELAPAPRRSRLIPAVGVAAIVVAVAIVVGRDCDRREGARDAANDARAATIDAMAGIDADHASVPGPIDAGTPEDATPADARREPPRDGRDRAPIDARGPTIDAPAAATGRLRVGADPWGEVLLDGKPLGRAPNEWTVPAGRHAVEVVFPSDGTELRRRFDVDVPAGGRESIQATFTSP